jgi:steroid delta-isomerase-like uncharacterized protein
MSEDSKALMRRFNEEVNAGNLDVIDELLSEDFVEHEEFPGIEPTREGVKQFFAMLRSAFPDLRMEDHEMVAEGDLVFARSTMSGTHQGEFMSLPPTGKRMEVQVMDLVRLRDGKAVEHWGVTDAMTMMQQLGAMPEEAPA